MKLQHRRLNDPKRFSVAPTLLPKSWTLSLPLSTPCSGPRPASPAGSPPTAQTPPVLLGPLTSAKRGRRGPATPVPPARRVQSTGAVHKPVTLARTYWRVQCKRPRGSKSHLELPETVTAGSRLLGHQTSPNSPEHAARVLWDVRAGGRGTRPHHNPAPPHPRHVQHRPRPSGDVPSLFTLPRPRTTRPGPAPNPPHRLRLLLVFAHPPYTGPTPPLLPLSVSVQPH